ncbi:MAG TPA: S41 family peptidase [Pyrinomonadaceae bacterium]|nr:S41 family peptidase [Pyrinomonadaceae bacterium]
MRALEAAFALSLLFVLMIIDPNLAPGQTAGPQQQPPDTTVDAATRKEVIDNLLKRLNDSYVFPETAAKMGQSVRARAAAGEYDKIESARQFAETITAHLREVSRDKHLGVHFFHRGAPPEEEDDDREPSAEQREQMRRQAARVNFGFERVERLPGNVGYLDFRFFIDPEVGKETVAAAFNFLANTDALIIDLRKNGGGDPKMVALICSYLFGPEPVHLNDLYWREGNRTEEYWTLKEVAGRRYAGKDVYVLTSNRTFSGAEEFSYNLKNLKRATIIGETTGGGAHPGRGMRLAKNFGAFIPTGRAISPVTKTNWEGTGVEPDVKVPADQALKVAHLAALKKGAERLTDEDLKREYQRHIDMLQKELGDAQAKK